MNIKKPLFLIKNNGFLFNLESIIEDFSRKTD